MVNNYDNQYLLDNICLNTEFKMLFFLENERTVAHILLKILQTLSLFVSKSFSPAFSFSLLSF